MNKPIEVDIAALDLGTPAVLSDTQITVRIDGKPVVVPAGTSIMRAASLAGTQIPKLCATDSLEAFGSCRMCLVEVEGRKGTPASCTTLVRMGCRSRPKPRGWTSCARAVMELYISDHPLDCLTCSANGDCELQDTAGEVGLRSVRYTQAGANHLDAGKDSSNPYFSFDASKCIVCSRCVRACSEVQGTFASRLRGAVLIPRCPPAKECVPGQRMCFLRRLCPGLPNRDPSGNPCH